MIHKVTVTVGDRSVARAVEAPNIPTAVRKALLCWQEELPDVTIRVEQGSDGMVLVESPVQDSDATP